MSNITTNFRRRFRTDDPKSKRDILEDNLLKDTLESIGSAAFGVHCIQLRGFTEAPAEWFDLVCEISNPSEALSRLTDESNPDFFLQEDALVPDVGLLGTLWNDVQWDHHHNASRKRMPMKQIDYNHIL